MPGYLAALLKIVITWYTQLDDYVIEFLIIVMGPVSLNLAVFTFHHYSECQVCATPIFPRIFHPLLR